ncbi:GNAT family protein [Mesobacillus jeotgali]|uniref:GNAT family protein n=1 Tax=Mesobacillus jeotgali TaxID=129985 RepID=A0ABY9VQP5_9BACI|nr:GNAT family protein [Mesobacillus jeotgali]WNF25192.1 GNAT family protein [Mesobacillus jeotgali]
MEKKFPVIETDRLILKEIIRDDAEDIFKYLSDENVMKYYGLEPFKSIDEAMEEIGWYQSIFDEGSGVRWGITLKGHRNVIGSCGFLNKVPQHYRSEIGFELSKEYWGKGIANEALAAVIQYGFEQMNLQRIQALIEPLNLSSQKLVERNGFIKEGLMRNYEYTCGKFDDLFMYSLIKQDVETGSNT